MDDFYKKVQMLLMKKNQEYGELRLLSSRATTESVERIEDICKSIVQVCKTCNIPIREKNLKVNEKCVAAYKYLLLNTNFENQTRLAEDMVYGHLVDMCPPLSLYLFMQIIWDIEYEEILIESFLYLPLDLCTEIADNLRTCVEELPFERSTNILHSSISKLYARFDGLKNADVQSTNIEATVKSLSASFQEIVALLSSPRITQFEELRGLKKFERYGIMLKLLIQTIAYCFKETTKTQPQAKHAKYYKITFGSEKYVKCDSAIIEKTLQALSHELTSVLLKMIKEIDCNIYLAWAELDDKENPKTSLQRSIGNDCYEFLEFMKNDEQLSKDTHLMECLQQLASKPDDTLSGFVLTLEELCQTTETGKVEHRKELMNRYKEWDHATLEFIEKNQSVWDKDECLTLLDYLTYIMKQPGKEGLKQFSYPLVTKILMLQNVTDIYEIIVEYVTKYDGSNYLELQHTDETFDEFIRKNSNLRTPTNLRTVLLFILKNPKMILATLVKITIGYSIYENTLIAPNDLLLLSPFLSIKSGKNDTFLTEALRAICLQNKEWNTKKFVDFVTVMLDGSVINVDGLMNNVFIPYLKSPMFSVSNMNSILNCIRKLQTQCTRNTSTKELIISLAKRMSSLRQRQSLQRCLYSEICSYIARILEYFLDLKTNKIGTEAKREIRKQIESIVEPIDKMHLAPVWFFPRKEMNAVELVQDYERRYFLVMDKLKENPKMPENLRNYLSTSSPLREDFLRHLITRSTEAEYHKLGTELTILYWFIFGWNDELTAYDSFLRLTVDGCCLSLEYPSVGPADLFLFLLKCFTRFCKTFVRLEGMKSPERVYRYLIDNVNRLELSIKDTIYSSPFSAFRTRLSNDLQQESPTLLQDVLNMLELFNNQCTEVRDETNESETVRTERSARVTSFYVVHQVISACIKVPAKEAQECVARMNELFCSNQSTG